MKPYTVSYHDHRYADLVAAVREGKEEDEIKEIVNRGEKLMKLSGGFLKIDGNQVYANDIPVPPTVVTMLDRIAREGLSTEPYEKFILNLIENPSNNAFNQCLLFLENVNLPITEDGCFLAYKRVRSDYTDCKTGTIDNSVGAKPSMNRLLVDDRREVTCSHGLHVCSYQYLASFGGAHTMVCKVNPRDVVSVPDDYNNAKMRVCAYEVVFEVDDDRIREDNFFKSSIYDDKTGVFNQAFGFIPYNDFHKEGELYVVYDDEYDEDEDEDDEGPETIFSISVAEIASYMDKGVISLEDIVDDLVSYLSIDHGYEDRLAAIILDWIENHFELGETDHYVRQPTDEEILVDGEEFDTDEVLNTYKLLRGPFSGDTEKMMAVFMADSIGTSIEIAASLIKFIEKNDLVVDEEQKNDFSDTVDFRPDGTLSFFSADGSQIEMLNSVLMDKLYQVLDEKGSAFTTPASRLAAVIEAEWNPTAEVNNILVEWAFRQYDTNRDDPEEETGDLRGIGDASDTGPEEDIPPPAQGPSGPFAEDPSEDDGSPWET